MSAAGSNVTADQLVKILTDRLKAAHVVSYMPVFGAIDAKDTMVTVMGEPAQLALGALIALALRWAVSLYPYSGSGKPPMYGDYEAQRHWQEVALHIPADRWYRNTTQNDLQYWGLDYPPLTAYHSLAMAHLADLVDPESVVLFSSRGHESDRHKLFMRATVFVADLYFYIPATIAFFFVARKIRTREMRAGKMSTVGRNVFLVPGVASRIALAYPGLILIDHGHFQYNCVSLGLFVWATVFILLDKCVLASFFFALAVNYKQMELYHSLPFFLYLLRRSIPTDRKNASKRLIFFAKIASTVLATFAVIWLPFLGELDSLLAVLKRLFPLARGVFEDKVANVWCSINVVVKLKEIFDNETMAKVCLATTGLAVLPSSVDLFLRPNANKFILSLINASLSFFLFSFQVHEKSILLCAVPALLRLPLDPVPCFWFLLVSTFSMLPLLLKDGLIIAYVSLTGFYLLSFAVALMVVNKSMAPVNIFNVTEVNNLLKGTKNEYNNIFYKAFNVMYAFSLVTMSILTICLVFVTPPARYPDLFPLLISSFSCFNFLLFYIYFNYCQLIIPNKDYIVYKKKVN